MRIRALGLVILLSVPWAAAGALGRLFFTPEQRRALERPSRAITQHSTQEIRRPVASPNKWFVNGTLSQNGKPALVWIDGKPQPPAKPPLAAQPLDEVRLRVQWRGKAVVVKPGQRLEVGDDGTARVEEIFER